MLFCPLLLSLICCVASSPVDTVGSWEPLETALDSCALSAHVRTFSHQGGVMVKVSKLLRLIGCWVIIAVDSWWKLNSHLGVMTALNNCWHILKIVWGKCANKAALHCTNKFKKQRLYFKPNCNQKRRTGFSGVLCDWKRRWVSQKYLQALRFSETSSKPLKW